MSKYHKLINILSILTQYNVIHVMINRLIISIADRRAEDDRGVHREPAAQVGLGGLCAMYVYIYIYIDR